MPARKAVPYSEVAALIEPLAARVRALEAVHLAAMRDVDAARDRAGEAYAAVVESVRVLRKLLQVLTDSACSSDRTPDVPAVLAEAQQLLLAD